MKVLTIEGLKHLIDELLTLFAPMEHTHAMYDGTGEADDAPMTQKAVTEALGEKLDTERVRLESNATFTDLILQPAQVEGNTIQNVYLSVESAGQHKPRLMVNDTDGSAYAHWLYSNLNKPTLGDIGAAAANHDHGMTARFDGTWSALVVNNTPTEENSARYLMLGFENATGKAMFEVYRPGKEEGEYLTDYMYSERHRPTPADIGAATAAEVAEQSDALTELAAMVADLKEKIGG